MSRSLSLTVAALVLLAACGGKQPPEVPTPEPAPTATPAAPAPTPTDDGEAARRAQAEAEARAAAERQKALTAELTSMIFFDYDRSDIRPDDAANLDRKGAILQANSSAKIRIAGHADERGSDEYNLALGSRRAAAAKRHLENKGVDGGRIETISYGEERPLQQGADEGAFAQNRRDEFTVISGGSALMAPR
jgi:peptidoglycan-associated lipoprotein